MKNLSFIALVLVFSGCSLSNKCKNAICTQLFAMITVELSNTGNPDLKGVTTRSLKVSNGEILKSDSSPSSLPNNGFVVVDDSNLKALEFNKTSEVDFEISKDGKLIKTVRFSIKTDCCHVNKQNGPDTVSLD
ncbi:MAG: hypothetical protein H6605_02235 [Flavobacteriales bacterium]|nr:hypothetical protein [Flavobacteriales bacterium]